MDKKISTYEGLIEQSPIVSKIVTDAMAELVFENSEHTVSALEDLWISNTRRNLKLLDKHAMLADSMVGFGRNKAIIGVGAGPSFNINKHKLKEIFLFNIRFELSDQPFIIVASNKMFKPLLKMGIRPHFVMLTDAGDALYEQLCSGIAKKSKNHILITGFHTSPKILKKWQELGNHILFYLIGGDTEKEMFTEHTGLDTERYYSSQGGNILNTLWILATRIFECPCYITVGNDLSFEYSHDKAEREKGFYAVGDYRTNILNQRDEAKDNFAWMGISRIYESSIVEGKMMMDFGVKGLSRQLWIYKTWMEVQAAIWAEKHKFFIYNASESGVLGVLARDYSMDKVMDRSNWYLIDELIPGRWLTTTLDIAATQFLEAKLWLKNETRTGAGSAILLPGQTDTAKTTGQKSLLQ